MKRSAYDGVQDLNFKILTFFGYWKVDSERRIVRVLYSTYSTFVVFLVTLGTLLQLMDLKNSWTDVNKASINLSGTSTSVLSIGKIYLFKWKMDQVARLQREFQNYLHVPGVGLSSEDREILERNAARFMKTCKTLYTLVGPTVVFWWIVPLMDSDLPVRYWLPFEVRTFSFAFFAVYVYQCVFLAYIGANVATMDLLLCQYIFLICSHFDILESNIRKIGHREPTRKRIRDCVRHHQQILRVVNEVDRIFRVSNLIHLLGAAVLISVTEYDLIQKVSTMNSQSLRQTGNMGSAFFDIFIYCYYGSYLEEKGVGIAFAVYNCPWYELDLSSRRMLAFMMHRAQRKTRISAGKLVNVDLVTYLNIIRISYNLLTLLRQTTSSRGG